MVKVTTQLLLPGFLLSICLAACGSSGTAAPVSSSPRSSGASSEVQRLQRVGAFLATTVDALKKNEIAAAKQSFSDFDDGWNAIEVYVKARSDSLYTKIEEVQGKVDKQLIEGSSPKADELVPQVQQIQSDYAEAVKLAQAGPALNPVLDQLEELRDVRIPLRHTVTALKKGDVATAKTEYKKFDDRWDDVETYVKDRSPDMYRDVEDRMSQVKIALLKADNPSASQAQPLADSLLTKYNEALALVAKGVTTA